MAARGRPPKPETLVARAAVAAFQQQTAAQATPADRVRSRFLARYDAAGQGKRLAGWNPPSSGPNRAIEGLQTIRNRARDSSRNDWSGASANRKWSTNLIGVGITPRFKRIKSKTRKQALTDLYEDWVALADADCVLDFYGLQTLAVRSWLDGGEVFARRRARFDDEGLPVPMQVQLLEADMCPLFDATSFAGLPTGNRILSGIEFNKRGRRIAYWFFKEHPGDNPTGFGSGSNPSADTLVRVAASEVAHIFEPTRPGQLRGVSMLAPVLNRLRNIENFDDATLTRQQLANLLVGFITQELPPMTGDEELNPITGQPDDETPQNAEGQPLVGLRPGLMQSLNPGEKVEWSNPPEAGTNYPEYMRTQHMGTAAAVDLPYEVFSGDIKDISDRTLRVIINEFRRLAEQRQWQIVIPMFCRRVMVWFAEAALLVGQIGLDEFDDVRRAEWSPHGWAHIHPVQDPQGKLLEIQGGLRSRSSVIGERGDDPEQVDEERAADKEREDELGLTPVETDPNAEPGDEETPEEAEERKEIAQANTLLRAYARFQAGQPPAPAPAAPVVNATINVPATVVNATIQNSVEPTPVNVSVEQPDITVAAPNVTVNNSVEPTPVNVAAPNVTVNNEVDVPPAEVNVHLPNREVTSTIRRDANGNITNVTQVEKDLPEEG